MDPLISSFFGDKTPMSLYVMLTNAFPQGAWVETPFAEGKPKDAGKWLQKEFEKFVNGSGCKMAPGFDKALAKASVEAIADELKRLEGGNANPRDAMKAIVQQFQELKAALPGFDVLRGLGNGKDNSKAVDAFESACLSLGKEVVSRVVGAERQGEPLQTTLAELRARERAAMLADWFGDLPKELRASPKDSGFEYLVYVSSMSLHQRTRDLKDASLNKLEDLVQKLDSARADLKSKLGRASGSAEEEYDACAKAFTEFDESMRKLGRAVLDAAKGGKDEASDVARVALLVTEASRAFFDATVGDAPSRQGRQIAAADTDKCKEIVKGCLGELAKDKDGDRDRDLLER